MKEAMKKLTEVFLTCHFLISVAIGACGMMLGPDTKLGYTDLFVPALMALLCTIPTLLTIQPEKLTTKQIVVRKILQVLMVEVIVLSMIHFGFHGINSIGGAFTVVVSVLLVFVGVSLADWVRGCMEAEDLNRRLAQLQKGRKEDARYAALAPKATLEITEPALVAHPNLGDVEVKIDSAYFDGLSLTLAYRVSNSQYAEEYTPTEEERAQMRLDEPVIRAMYDNEPCLEVYEAYNEALRNGTPFGYRQYSIRARDHTLTDDGILLDPHSAMVAFDGAAFCEMIECKSPLPDELRSRDALTVTKKVYQHEYIIWFDGKDCWLSSSIKDIGIITATIPREKNQVKTFSGTGVIDGVECTFIAEVSPLAAVLTMESALPIDNFLFSGAPEGTDPYDIWKDMALVDQNGREYRAQTGIQLNGDKSGTVVFDGVGELPSTLTAYAYGAWEGVHAPELSTLDGVKLTPIE